MNIIIFLVQLLAVFIGLRLKRPMVTLWSINFIIYFMIHISQMTDQNAINYTFLCWMFGIVPLFLAKKTIIKLDEFDAKYGKLIPIIRVALLFEFIIRLIISVESRHTAIAADKIFIGLLIDQIEITLMYSLAILTVFIPKSKIELLKSFAILAVVAVASGSKGELILLLLSLELIKTHFVGKSQALLYIYKIAKIIPFILPPFIIVTYHRIKNDDFLNDLIFSENGYDLIIKVLEVIVIGRLNMLAILDKIMSSNVSFQYFSNYENLKLIITGIIPSILTDRPELNLGRYFAFDIGLNDSMTSYVAMTVVGESFINFGWLGVFSIFTICLSMSLIACYLNRSFKRGDIYYVVFILLCPVMMSFEMNVAAGFWRSVKMIVSIALLLMIISRPFKIIPPRMKNALI